MGGSWEEGMKTATIPKKRDKQKLQKEKKKEPHTKRGFQKLNRAQ